LQFVLRSEYFLIRKAVSRSPTKYESLQKTGRHDDSNILSYTQIS